MLISTLILKLKKFIHLSKILVRSFMEISFK